MRFCHDIYTVVMSTRGGIDCQSLTATAIEFLECIFCIVPKSDLLRPLSQFRHRLGVTQWSWYPLQVLSREKILKFARNLRSKIRLPERGPQFHAPRLTSNALRRSVG